MCRNADDASDIVQETLLAMARSVGDFRGESSIGSWLFTIARRFCMKKRRRSKFAPAHEDSLESLGPDQTTHLAARGPNPEEQAAGAQMAAALTAAIGSLDPAQREVLVMRDVEGLSAPEIARVLDLTVEAVKSRLHRARVTVRQQIAPLLAAPASGPALSGQCPDVVAMFSRHLEGDIAPATCAQMEAHLGRCEDCRRACDSLRSVLASCRALADQPVPPRVAAAVRSALRGFIATQATQNNTDTRSVQNG
jgi:RNA polymerase sigma-70 factor (ECF subfamily)